MKLSPVEKGRINLIEYTKYVDNLRSNGKKFPINQFGDANLSQIASACGFKRQVFGKKTRMGKQLEKDIQEIGTEIDNPKLDTISSSNRLDEYSKRLNILTKELNVLKAENLSLKKQLMTLENVQMLSDEKEASFEHMLQTGRRFVL